MAASLSVKIKTVPFKEWNDFHSFCDKYTTLTDTLLQGGWLQLVW